MAVKRIIDFAEDNSPDPGDYVAIDNSTPNATRRTRIEDMLRVSGEGLFATEAQGALADTALQPADVGSAAAEDVSYFATAAQGAKADTLPDLSADSMIVDNAAGTGRESKTFEQVRNILGVFDTEADFLAANISAPIMSVVIAGYHEAGDAGAHRKFRISTPSPVMPYHSQSNDGAWWEVSPENVIRPEMLGIRPHIVCEAETKAWYDGLANDIGYLHLAWIDLFIYLLKVRGLWDKASYMLMPGQDTVENGRVNMVAPGTGNAIASGTLIHMAGFGIKGDGVSGYLTLPLITSLFAQDNGALALFFEAGTLNGNVVANSAGASTALGVNPGSIASGNASFRFMSNTVTTYARGGLRKDLLVLSRASNSSVQYSSEGELVLSVANASTPIPANNVYLFRSGVGYQDDVVRFFMTFNQALTSEETDELSCLIRIFCDGLGGVVGRGPMCASIGFDAYSTPTEIRTALNACADLASKSKTANTVELGLGTYLVDGDYHGFKTAVETRGLDKFGSILRPDATVDKEIPIVSPGHFNGGESGFKIRRFTVHCATLTRGITDVGTQRPGGSGLSTNGSVDGDIEDMCIVDPVLHCIDVSNTGELDATGTDREYCRSPLPTKWDVGVASEDIRMRRITSFNSGDDHITAHYSRGGRKGYIEDTEHYFTSGRHPDGPQVSMGVEIDDGSWGFKARRVYSRSLARAAAAKSHPGNPAPIDNTFEDITSERCAQGVLFYDPNDAGRGNNTLRGLTYSRPYEVAPGEVDVIGYASNGMTGTRAYDLDISCRGDETFLSAAIQIQSASEDAKVDGFTVTNWKAIVDLPNSLQGETVRVTSTAVDASVRNGRIVNGGRYGVWDSGSIRPDYDNISIIGADVVCTIGFRVSVDNTLSYSAIKVTGTYTTPISIG